jgi:cytochrome c oxidase cbb3-type subunit III
MTSPKAGGTVVAAALALIGAILLGAAASHAANVPDAAKTYASYCANCHGNWGRGDGPVAPVLAVKPGDLADSARMARTSDEALFKAIKDGGAAVGRSSQMPGWGEGLDDEQIRGLVAFIRGLNRH